VLLIAEQGIGDKIQFIRYASLLQAAGARVAVVVPRRMMGILAGCPGIERLVADDEPWPEHDMYCELMSVCRYLTRSIAEIPAPIPYLTARPELVEQWREELSAYPGFRIGIAWQGSTADTDNRRVSVEHFAPIAQVPGVRLISLQPDGAAALRACGSRVPALDFGDRLDREHGAFQDTAAIMMNLDLVISSDTSIPHLAGALGRPVWMALRFAAEWRWLRDREDTPWYPTMRLFRQRARGDWSAVFERMAGELRARLSSPAG
jgi:hypothetical protein